jgi:hypothetical protein
MCESMNERVQMLARAAFIEGVRAEYAGYEDDTLQLMWEMSHMCGVVTSIEWEGDES